MIEFEEDVEEVPCHDILDTLVAYFLAPLFLEIVTDLFKNTSSSLSSFSSSYLDDNTAIFLAVMKTIEDNQYLIFKQLLSCSTDSLDIYLNIYRRY